MVSKRRTVGFASARDLEVLYQRPGFMLRRAHQIAVALFLRESAELGITTTQYGVMVVLRARPGIDQAALASLMGLDRSTTGLVVGKLEAAGLVARMAHPTDARRKTVELTTVGSTVLRRTAQPARRASERLVAPFNLRERKQFLTLLARLIATYDDVPQSPLERD